MKTFLPLFLMRRGLDEARRPIQLLFDKASITRLLMPQLNLYSIGMNPTSLQRVTFKA